MNSDVIRSDHIIFFKNHTSARILYSYGAKFNYDGKKRIVKCYCESIHLNIQFA